MKTLAVNNLRSCDDVGCRKDRRRLAAHEPTCHLAAVADVGRATRSRPTCIPTSPIYESIYSLYRLTTNVLTLINFAAIEVLYGHCPQRKQGYSEKNTKLEPLSINMTITHNGLPLASCKGNKACPCPTSIGQLHNRIANPTPHVPRSYPGKKQVHELSNVSRTSKPKRI